MVTYLYVFVLIVAFFWVGLYLGKGTRSSRRSLDFSLPKDAHLFRQTGPPRRTERVYLSVPIMVSGLDVKGEQFTESTHTVTLSGYGASILLRRQLKSASQINIQRLDKSREAVVRVLHELSKSDEGYLYGVCFVDPAVDLWGACQLLTEALHARAERDAAGSGGAQ